MASELDFKLTALALIARMNDEPEPEIINFFKKSVSCVREQAMRAIENSKLLQSVLSEREGKVFTTSKIFDLVKTFLTEREHQRLLEEQEWSNVSPSSAEEVSWNRPAEIAPSSWRVNAPTHAVDHHPDEDVGMGILASQLKKGDFLVRSTKTIPSRDQAKEHDLTAGEVFVISQVKGFGDGSNDAWFCGYKVKDPGKVQKWVFSGHTTKLFH